VTKAKTLSSILALAAGLLLAGCSNWPDSLNPGSWFEKPDPNANVPGPQKTYPKLSSVPEKPAPRDEAAEKKAEDELKADREAARAVLAPKLGEGLAADRESARYTDEPLRREQLRAAAPPQPAPPPEPVTTARNATRASPPQPPSQPSSPPPTPPQAVTAQPVASPPPQVAAAPPSAPVPAQPPAPAFAPPQAPQQQAALPPPPVYGPPPPALDVIAMAPVRSPGDPPPAASTPAMPSRGNLVWGAPPADIDLMRSGPRGRETSVATLRNTGSGPVLGGGPAARVMFASGSARLAPTDEAILRQVAEAYRRTGGTVTVVGHASQTAADRTDVRRQIANFSVSMDRANAVAQALQRYGVPGGAIAISAETDAVVLNDADGRRADVFLR